MARVMETGLVSLALLESSVDALSTTVKGLASSPSPAAIAQVPGEVSAVVTAASNFQSATKSKCS
jgi:hypothetical protein